jgi:hypothetical protein
MDPAGGSLPTEAISNRSAGLGSQDLVSGVSPHTSVDDYNRVMLQYTQRQLAAFTSNSPSARRPSGTSGSSGSSGPSSASSVTNIARTGSGFPPRLSGSSSYSSGRS